MSSWRSGRVISSIVRLKTGSTSALSTAVIEATPRSSARRRRRITSARACQGRPTTPLPTPRWSRSSGPRSVARRAFSSWGSWRAARSSTAVVAAGGRALRADVLVGDDGDRRVVDARPSRPRTAAASRRRRRAAAGPWPSRARGTRSRAGPTRGHSSSSSHARSSGSANAAAATFERSTTPPGATSSPQRSTTSATTSGSS